MQKKQNCRQQESLDQSLTMQRSLNIKPELETNSDQELKEKLINHPQSKFWHDKMIWYGPSGIGTGRKLEGFVDNHQLPFRKTFKERKMEQLGQRTKRKPFLISTNVCAGKLV